MGTEEAESAVVTLFAEETLELPAALNLPDGQSTGAAAARMTSESAVPPDILNCGLSQDQVVAELQPHLAAAENRVSKALQEVMGSIETRLLGALRQAAIDITEKLGKEAAACIVASERKAAALEQQLNSCKQQAMSMLMRLKHISDAQIHDAEKRILVERQRAQDAETRFYSAQESNKRLKAELKRKVQLLEEFQRNIYSAGTPQGLQVGFGEGSDGKKRGTKSKVSAGEWPCAIIPFEPASPDMSTGQQDFSRYLNCVEELQTLDIPSQASARSLTYRDAHTPTVGTPVIEVLPRGNIKLQVKENGPLTEAGNLNSNGFQERKSLVTENVLQVENISARVCRPLSTEAEPHTALSPVKQAQQDMEQAQLPLSEKVELKGRSIKECEEDKSCLTVEALHCTDEYVHTQVHCVEEYRRNVNHVDMEVQTSDGSQRRISYDDEDNQEAGISVDFTEHIVVGECPETAVESPSLGQGNSNIKVESFGGAGNSFLLHSGAFAYEIPEGVGQEEDPILEKVHLERVGGQENVETTGVTQQAASILVVSPEFGNHYSSVSLPSCSEPKPTFNRSSSNLPGEGTVRPQAQNGSAGNPVPRRKRKVGVLLPKHDYSIKEKNSERLQEDGGLRGGFSHLLTTAGVDTHISSRDSRRLMQGARQLFSLAERKWR